MPNRDLPEDVSARMAALLPCFSRVGMMQVWVGHLSQKHHDDADQQQTYQDEAEVDKQVLEVLTRLLRHLNR